VYFAVLQLSPRVSRRDVEDVRDCSPFVQMGGRNPLKIVMVVRVHRGEPELSGASVNGLSQSPTGRNAQSTERMGRSSARLAASQSRPSLIASRSTVGRMVLTHQIRVRSLAGDPEVVVRNRCDGRMESCRDSGEGSTPSFRSSLCRCSLDDRASHS
jgi:hypothetical protein